MQRYRAGLYVIVSISVVLLLLWGLDLTRSMAEDQPVSSYRADLNVWTEGPFLTMLQKTASVDQHNTAVCMIVFRSEHSILIWNRESRPGTPNDQPIHLSHLTYTGSRAGRVVLVTFPASHDAIAGPANRTILMCQILSGGEPPVVMPVEMPPT